MKKSIIMITLLIATVLSAVAGMEVIDKASFSATGDAAGTAIDRVKGATISDVALCLSVDTNKTLTVYRGKYETELQAAVSASTTVVIFTPSGSNSLNGFTITTDDFLLVKDTGSNGWQLRQVSAIGAYTSTGGGYTSYTVAANVTAAVNSPVYIIDATDNVSIPASSSTDQTNLRYMFTGFGGMPVYVKLATGSGPNSIVSGTVDYVK